MNLKNTEKPLEIALKRSRPLAPFQSAKLNRYDVERTRADCKP